MTVTIKRDTMTAQVFVRILGNDGTKIWLTVTEAQELRDFLVSEPSITPGATIKAIRKATKET